MSQWAEYTSVGDRYPGLSGLLLDQKIFADFSTEESVKKEHFGPAGQRLLKRHPLNNRDVQMVTEELADTMLLEGYMPHVTSIPIGMPADSKGETWMLAGGGRTDAVYLGHEKDPNNEYIKATIAQGMPYCCILDKRTPRDVVMHVIQHMNNYHGGSPNTFLQALSVVVDAEASWKAFAKDNRITSRSCPTSGELSDSARYAKHISQHYSKTFARWQHFDNAKTVLHHIFDLDSNFWSEYKKLVGQFTMFTAKSNPTPSAMNAYLHELVLVVREKFFKTISSDFLKILIVEFTKLASARKEGAAVKEPSICNSANAKLLATLLACPMQNSKARQGLSAEPGPKAKVEDDLEDVEQPTGSDSKRRRLSGKAGPKEGAKGKDTKGKVKAEHAGPRKAQACKASAAPTVEDPDHEITYFADLAEVVIECAHGYRIEQHFNNPNSHELVRTGLIFALEKAASLGSAKQRNYTMYSKLRPAFIEFGKSKFKTSFAEVAGEDLAVVLVVPSVVAPPPPPNSIRRLQLCISGFVQDTDLCELMRSFLDKNDVAEDPTIMLPVFTTIQYEVFKKNAKNKVDGVALLRSLAEVMAEHIPPSFVDVAAACVGLAQDETIPSEASHLFSSVVECEQFLQLRPKIALECISVFHNSKLIKDGALPNGHMMQADAAWGTVVAIDSVCTNRFLHYETAKATDASRWAEAWELMFETVAGGAAPSPDSLGDNMGKIRITTSRRVLAAFLLGHPEDKEDKADQPAGGGSDTAKAMQYIHPFAISKSPTKENHDFSFSTCRTSLC